MNNTKVVGDLSEAKLMTALLDRGYVVAVPWGDNQRYDLILERGGKFERVQIKTGRVAKGAIVVDAFSYTTKGGRGYQGQVEYIGVYCPQLKTAYLVPMERIGKFGFNLRIDEPKNHQRKRILWAKDFQL